jgi:cob(I)alamin adenosyltransferase
MKREAGAPGRSRSRQFRRCPRNGKRVKARHQATVSQTWEGAAPRTDILTRESGDRPEAFGNGIAKGGVTMSRISFSPPYTRWWKFVTSPHATSPSGNASPSELRHRERMQHKKAVVDAAVGRATQSRGLLLVLTGKGKGKSSSAFGMVARALGHGLRVGVVQFVKARQDTGETAFFRHHPAVSWQVLGEGFSWEPQDRLRDATAAERAWTVAQAMLADPELGLVLLDELTFPLKYGYLDIGQVLADMRSRPPHQHVVVTGRAAPPALVEAADTVTEMRDVKHAFHTGVHAQAGIDL